ncbi:hypothetical protein GCM10010411_75590 [Actinomadura fulvescens]|uniref:Lipoprotein n=1 Tax=Actinomadura fulvescens TaxID=46160 RepID=A0ABN3QIG1_9ACTN
MRSKTWATVGALLVLSVSSASCANERPAERRQADQAPAAGAEVRGLVLPLDVYSLTAAETTLVATATDKLVQACMSRQGLHWPQLVRTGGESWPNRRRYGLAEPEVAAKYGYHPTPDPESDARAAQSDAREQNLSSAQRTAAFGQDGRSGCFDQAERVLRKGVPKEPEWSWIEELGADLYNRSKRTAEVTQVDRSWSACMRRGGFGYTNPMAAGDDQRWATQQATPAEIAVARADVDCKRRTSHTPIWWRVEVDLQRKAIKSHSIRLRASLDNQRRYLANARQAAS